MRVDLFLITGLGALVTRQRTATHRAGDNTMIRKMQSGSTITTIERARGRYAYRVRSSDYRIPHRHDFSRHTHTWDEALKAADEVMRKCKDVADRCEEAQRANGITKP